MKERKKECTLTMASKGSTNTQHTNLKKSCRVRVRKKSLRTMIRSFLRKVKEVRRGEVLKSRLKMTKNQWEAQ